MQVPDGWTLTNISAVAELTAGGTPSTKKKEYWGGDVFWMSSGEVHKKNIYSVSGRITKEGLANSSAKKIPINSILIALAGQGKTRGIVAVNKIELTTNQSIAAIMPKADLIYYLYLFYNLESRYSELRKLSTGDGGRGGLNLSLLKSIRIILPTYEEQQKIAQILSTWDKAIEKLEALIAAKQKRKKALMQQLLTGKKRFAGFEGEWTEVRLGDVGAISSAGIDKKIVSGEPEVRLLNFLDVFRRNFIFNHELNHKVTSPKAKISKCDVRKGDIFFTPSSETRDELAIPAVAVEDMPGVVYSYHVVRFRLHKNWDLKFRSYIFQSEHFCRQAYRLGDGSGQRYVISQDNFRKMTVKIPSYPEQEKIGSILSSAEKEIETHENQLSALKQQKKGLMQQLLTGKKRVKLEEAA